MNGFAQVLSDRVFSKEKLVERLERERNHVREGGDGREPLFISPGVFICREEELGLRAVAP